MDEQQKRMRDLFASQPEADKPQMEADVREMFRCLNVVSVRLAAHGHRDLVQQLAPIMAEAHRRYEKMNRVQELRLDGAAATFTIRPTRAV